METLVLLLIVPIAWPFVARLIWGRSITPREIAINLLVGIVLAGGVWGAGRYAQTRDVEILNGQVTGKKQEMVSCDHSYSCNCHQSCSGSGSHKSCSTTCSTCYEHNHDYDWVLKTSLDHNINISRVDRQGVLQPARFARAKAGDPVALEHVFTNYVKAASNSLFHSSPAVETSLAIPAYPNQVYDYHYVNRALVAGVEVPDLVFWNRDIADTLRMLGPAKQVNIIVVFAKTADPGYAASLEHAWLGGKKNDVIVVLGTPDFPNLAWVRILSWTDNQMFKVTLRDRLQALKTVDREQVMAVIAEEIRGGFVRKKMEDFAYLAYEIDPPGWVVLLAFLLSTVASVGLSWHFANNRD